MKGFAEIVRNILFLSFDTQNSAGPNMPYDQARAVHNTRSSVHFETLTDKIRIALTRLARLGAQGGCNQHGNGYE